MAVLLSGGGDIGPAIKKKNTFLELFFPTAKRPTAIKLEEGGGLRP